MGAGESRRLGLLVGVILSVAGCGGSTLKNSKGGDSGTVAPETGDAKDVGFCWATATAPSLPRATPRPASGRRRWRWGM